MQTADNLSAAAAVNQKLSIRSVIGSNAGIVILFIASYYRQLLADIKMKDYNIKTYFVKPQGVDIFWYFYLLILSW